MDSSRSEPIRPLSTGERLAIELEEVLNSYRQEKVPMIWNKLDDPNDALCSGLISLFAAFLCFVEIGVAQIEVFRGIAGVDSAFLVAFFLVTIAFHRFLRVFPRRERIRMVFGIIERLRMLPEDGSTGLPTDSSSIARFQDKRNINFSTATKRNLVWRKVPNNLLIKGDIVALPASGRCPADLRRTSDGKIFPRDSHVDASSDAPSDNPAEASAHEFLKLVCVEEYTVQSTPLVADIKAFLERSEASQTTDIGQEIESLSKQLRAIATLVFILIGLILQGIRYALRPDGYDFARLILLRSVTLICFLPSLSWPFFRFAFELYSFKRMSSLTGESSANPLGFPLIPSTLVRVMGSITALCGLDEDALLMDRPIVEEVFLFEGGKKTQIIDCCLDETNSFGLRFEDPQWRSHLGSLKPLGLVCALAGEDIPFSPETKPKEIESKTELEVLFQQRVEPLQLVQLARTMGFQDDDVKHFRVRARCTLISSSTSLSLPSSCNYPAAHLMMRPLVECLVVEIPDVPSTVSSASTSYLAPLTAVGRSVSDIGQSTKSEHFLKSTNVGISAIKSSSALMTSSTSSSGGLTGNAGPSSSTPRSHPDRSATPDTLSSSQPRGPTKSDLAKHSSQKTPVETHVEETRHDEPSLPRRSASSSNVVSGTKAGPSALLTRPQLVTRSSSGGGATLNSLSNEKGISSKAMSIATTTATVEDVPRKQSLITIDPAGLALTSSASLKNVGESVKHASSKSSLSVSTPSTALHLVCWGNAHLLLGFCTEYWDGESIWSLDEDSRLAILKISTQWEKEDFDCIALAYAPLSCPTFQDRNLFIGQPLQPGDDPFVVLDRPPLALNDPQPNAQQQHQALAASKNTPSQMPSPKGTLTKSSSLKGFLSDGQRSRAYHHASPSQTTDFVTASVSETTALQRKVQIICGNLSKGLIFNGMVGARDQPAQEISELVEHLQKCGIRFVYFSPRDARCGRKIAEKMGLETDWNTSISLANPDEAHTTAISQQATALQTTLKLASKQSSSVRESVYSDWEHKARMPKGIEAIKKHIKQVDDVPLRVSVFTECVPETSAEMIGVMREHAEVVAVFGNPLAGSNLRANLAANVSIGVVPRFCASSARKGHQEKETAKGNGNYQKTKTRLENEEQEWILSMDLGRIACSFNFCESKSGVLMSLLGEGRIALYNYRQSNQSFVGLGLICFVSQTAVLCACAPDLFTLGHTLWLVWVMIPLMSCPCALRPRNRFQMLWERMPWKQSALLGLERNYRCIDPRYVVYALVRLLPTAIFVLGIFFWVLTSLDPTASINLKWSTRPSPVIINSNNASTLVYDLTATQAAQSLAMLAFVWSGCFVSATFASRTELEKDLEFRFWVVWTFFTVLSVGLQMAYNCVMASLVVGSCVAGAFPSFESVATRAEIWSVLFLLPPIFVPLAAWPVKRHDRRYYNKAMQMMRLDFETKLGQFSPK